MFEIDQWEGRCEFWEKAANKTNLRRCISARKLTTAVTKYSPFWFAVNFPVAMSHFVSICKKSRLPVLLQFVTSVHDWLFLGRTSSSWPNETDSPSSRLLMLYKAISLSDDSLWPSSHFKRNVELCWMLQPINNQFLDIWVFTWINLSFAWKIAYEGCCCFVLTANRQGPFVVVL